MLLQAWKTAGNVYLRKLNLQRDSREATAVLHTNLKFLSTTHHLLQLCEVSKTLKTKVGNIFFTTLLPHNCNTTFHIRLFA